MVEGSRVFKIFKIKIAQLLRQRLEKELPDEPYFALKHETQRI
jgi:hypothetical protein